MSDFAKKMEEDKEFRDKLQNAASGEEGRAIIREAGFEVKDVTDFLKRVRSDADFMEAVSEKESIPDKMTFIMNEGYFFRQDELDEAQEKIAEEEFDTLAGAGCGLYVEGHCGTSCESEDWSTNGGCPSYFKCTWG